MAAVAVAAVGLAVPAATPATSSKSMLVGVLDEANTLYGSPERTFPILRELRVKALRMNLYWGGRFGVAERRPSNGSSPRDAAYDWRIYDRTVQYASEYGIRLVFSIYGTPAWANGGAGLNRAPRDARDLQRFAAAAAARYSGSFRGADGRRIPAVKYWLAWTEPNNPLNLVPQFRRVGGRWVVQSARDYAKICNAVYDGVHAASALMGEKVACGVTAPRGNNKVQSSRPSTSPIAFLRAAKLAGMRRFDAYAHHPYYGQKSESPSTKPSSRTAVTLANINDLIREVDRLYGGRRPLWITEYGYQTNPPDRAFGVSYARQAKWLTKAYSIARANPRIGMMLWFLIKDEPKLSGWQSGFLTVSGKRKPSFRAFQRVPR